MSQHDRQAPAAGDNGDIEVSAGVAVSPPFDKLLATAKLISPAASEQRRRPAGETLARQRTDFQARLRRRL